MELHFQFNLPLELKILLFEICLSIHLISLVIYKNLFSVTFILKH